MFHLVLLVYIYCIHRRRIFVESANSEGAILFCKVSLNLIILFQCGIFSQIQVKTKNTKKQKGSSPLSGFISVRNFGSRLYLECQGGITCQKTPGGQTYFAPFSVRPERAPPPSRLTPVLVF